MRGLNIGGGDNPFFSSGSWDILDYVEDTYKHNRKRVRYNVDLEQDGSWPIPLMEYDMVYSSHTLEHLTDKAIEHTLSQAYEVMKYDGVIRITVPDATVIWQACKTKNEDVIRNAYGVMFINTGLPYLFERSALRTFYSDIMDKWAPVVPNDQLAVKWNHLKWEEVKEDLNNMSMLCFISKYKKAYEDMNKYGSIRGHRNWFTASRLFMLLRDAGFRDIGQSKPQKSRCDYMRDDNFDQTWPKSSLFIEAIK